MNNLLRTGSAALFLLVLAACSSGVKLDTPTDSSAGMATGNTAAADPNGVGTVTIDPLNDANGPLAKRSVYFDYDSYVVKDDYRGVIDAHGHYLQSHPARKVLIQGNTDERGGSEYNLALGQKRAEAVRKQLSLMGVPDGEMEAVSLGKEKPKAMGHDESAWAENRRADLVYN